jgi:hypothetical protein
MKNNKGKKDFIVMLDSITKKKRALSKSFFLNSIISSILTQGQPLPLSPGDVPVPCGKPTQTSCL